MFNSGGSKRRATAWRALWPALALTFIRTAALAGQDHVLFDFENGTFQGWTLSGNCWDTNPASDTLFDGKIIGIVGHRYLSTLHPRRGMFAVGKALSPAFVLDAPRLSFRIGGGNYPGVACLNLLIDGKTVATATGNNEPSLVEKWWDVRAYMGKTARLQLVDNTRSINRGYIMVDQIAVQAGAQTHAYTVKPESKIDADPITVQARPDEAFRQLFAVDTLPSRIKVRFTETAQKKLAVYLAVAGTQPLDRIGNLGIAFSAESGRVQRSGPTNPVYSTARLRVSLDPGGPRKEIDAYRISLPYGFPGNQALRTGCDLVYNFRTREDYVVYRWTSPPEVGSSIAFTGPSQDGPPVVLAEIPAKRIVPGHATRIPLPAPDRQGETMTLLFVPKRIAVENVVRPQPNVRAELVAQTPIGKIARYTYSLTGLGEPPARPSYAWDGPSVNFVQPRLLTLFTPPGGVEVAYQDRTPNLVRVIRISAGHKLDAVTIPCSNGHLGAIARSSTGEYYLYTNADGINPKTEIVRVSADGREIARTALDNKKDGFNLYELGTPTANLVLAGGVLFLTSSRFMQDGGDGLHHQCCFGADFDPSTLALVKNFGQLCSHSLDNRLGFDGSYFIALNLGDNYPRGIIIHKIAPDETAGKVIFTFKTAMGAKAIIRVKDGNRVPLAPGKWSNDNSTYTELGDVTPTRSGYLVAFAAEKSPDNRLAKEQLNEPRNIGVVLVTRDFERIPQEQNVVPPSLILTSGADSPPFGFFTFQGDWAEQQYRGVVWLTDYTDKQIATAARPKLVPLDDGRYLILWERWTQSRYVNTQALVVDEQGHILVPLMDLGTELRLTAGDRITLKDGHLIWPSVSSGQMTINVWKITANAPASDKASVP